MPHSVTKKAPIIGDGDANRQRRPLPACYNRRPETTPKKTSRGIWLKESHHYENHSKHSLAAGTAGRCAGRPIPSTPLAQVVIAGNDNKALVVDGKLQIDPQGVQSVSIIDIGPDGPALRATVEVPNSIFGPPTNLAVTANNRLALVAEAVRIDPDASPPKFMPSDKLHVIDLEANPPRVIDTLTVGRQPSGMAISPDGAPGDHRQPRRDVRVGTQHRGQAGAFRGQGGRRAIRLPTWRSPRTANAP